MVREGTANVPSLRCGFLRGAQLSRDERLLLERPRPSSKDVGAAGLRAMLMGASMIIARFALGNETVPRTRGDLLSLALTVLPGVVLLIAFVHLWPRIPIRRARSACPEGSHCVGEGAADLEEALRSGLGGRAVVIGRFGAAGICTWAPTKFAFDPSYPRMSVTRIEPERVIAFAVLGDEAPALLRIVVRGEPRPIYASCVVAGLRETFANWRDNPWDITEDLAP